MFCRLRLLGSGRPFASEVGGPANAHSPAHHEAHEVHRGGGGSALAWAQPPAALTAAARQQASAAAMGGARRTGITWDVPSDPASGPRLRIWRRRRGLRAACWESDFIGSYTTRTYVPVVPDGTTAGAIKPYSRVLNLVLLPAGTTPPVSCRQLY
eukprot:SAG31_NODE_708_length_12684_cov_8.500199_9_plen_155_part_00